MPGISFLSEIDGIKVGSFWPLFKSIIKQEDDSLNDLKRGVYAKSNIKSNKVLTNKDVYFAMPLQKNQLSVEEWSENGKS